MGNSQQSSSGPCPGNLKEATLSPGEAESGEWKPTGSGALCGCTRSDGVCGHSPGHVKTNMLEAGLTSQFLQPVNLLFSACQFELSLYADSMLTEDLLCARQPKGPW